MAIGKAPNYRKNRAKAKAKARDRDTGFDTRPVPVNFKHVIPDLPPLGPGSYWALVALKALAAMGFMAAANAVILYAC